MNNVTKSESFNLYRSAPFTQTEISVCAKQMEHVRKTLLPIFEDILEAERNIIRKKDALQCKKVIYRVLPIIPISIMLICIKPDDNTMEFSFYCGHYWKPALFGIILSLFIKSVLNNKIYEPACDQVELTINESNTIIDKSKDKLKRFRLNNLDLSVESLEYYQTCFQYFNNSWALQYASLEYLKMRPKSLNPSKLKHNEETRRIFQFMTNKETISIVQNMTRLSGF